MSDPTLSIRSERITCPDGQPMLSAHRCATRMDLPRESSSDSGYLNEYLKDSVQYPRRSTELAMRQTHDQPRCVEVPLIPDAEDLAIAKPRTTKGARRLLAQSPRRPPALHPGTPRLLQSRIVPGKRREPGSLRRPSLRDPSQGNRPADGYKFAESNRVTDTDVNGDGDCPLLLRYSLP